MEGSIQKKKKGFSIASVFILPIKLYQKILSPLFPGSCRFHPTCSHYAIEALEKHGIFKGTLLSVRRISRCQPWGGSGYDPVPDKNN